ncbi:divergent protein kinase domain 2A-like isoform X2 [Oratosquilla oratoria]|uniref:divergent protein kinase domain 2A-like isoform X2 n=1 Tax=Oratosquilla oratoria TaxID=337810 RepID=UPI003F771417
MHLLKIHYQKLFGFLTFIMIIIVIMHVMDSEEVSRPKSAASTHRAASNHENAIVIDEPNLGSRISQDKKSSGASVYLDFFSDLLKEEKCPLCFGQELCEDISAGFLVLTSDISEATQAGSSYYPAELGVGHKLLIKAPSKEKFALLDAGLCANMTPNSGCIGMLSAKDSFINRPDLISSKNLEKIYHIMHTSHKEMPLMMCPSVKFLALMEKSFDLDDNHVVTQEEKMMLYTTLAVAPDLMVLKFLTKANVNVGFPHYVGSCGRVGVMEGDMTPLRNFLDEPFNIRASLGAQLLTMVDDFMDDPEWYLFYTDWSFDQISVDKEGELVMTDMTKMAIVDKGLFKDDYDEDEGANRNQEICNSECFQRFTHDAYSPSANLEETCVRVEEMGHMMYAAVCAMILSDMDQHKFKDYFSSKPSTRIIPRTTKGLLHDIPDADKDTVEELLLECVEETAGGGRIQAAEELRDYLSDFLIDEDDEDDEDGEDPDENIEDQDYDDDYDLEDEGETKGDDGWKVIT